jgi:hypothetical protein
MEKGNLSHSRVYWIIHFLNVVLTRSANIISFIKHKLSEYRSPSDELCLAFFKINIFYSKTAPFAFPAPGRVALYQCKQRIKIITASITSPP